MITLTNVRDFLKTIATAEHYYIGKLDNKQSKSIGVYTLKRSEPPTTAIGGKTTYDTIAVTVLIHWNNNANETEVIARQLYEALRTVKEVTINEIPVYVIQLLVPEPVDVGTDDSGVYERVIEFKLYFERK